MAASDTYLLARWIDHRDAEAFRVLAMRYATMVFGTCRRVLGGMGDAEGVAQECFETLAALPRIPNAPFPAWLHRVAMNRALDKRTAELRRVDREARYAQEMVETRIESGEWEDIYIHVDEAITAIPDELRDPLVACYLSGKSHNDIAHESGIPRRTVTGRIHKGVEEIRRILTEKGVTVTAVALTGALTASVVDAAPENLTAGLGKIALAGARGPGKTVMSGYLLKGGMVLMTKKVVMGVAAAIFLCAGLFWMADYFRIIGASQPGIPRIPGEILSAAKPESPESEMDKPEAEAQKTTPAVPGALNASIFGKAMDTDGDPLMKWRIFAAPLINDDQWGESIKTVSTSNGDFSFNHIPPGHYRLYALPLGQTVDY